MKSLINSEIFRSRPLSITTPSSFLYPTLNYVQKWSIVHLYPADLTFAYRTKLGGSTNECAEFKRRGRGLLVIDPHCAEHSSLAPKARSGQRNP